MGTVEHRLNIGPAVTRLNRDIEKVAALRRSASLVWIDKGKWLWPETLHALRRNSGAPIVHYTPDPQLASNQSRHFERCIPLYDHLITTKKFEVDGYRKLGARHVVLTHQSYDERRFRPVPPSPTYASDVAFIGHFEPHYGRCVAIAGRSGATVRIWVRSGRRFDPISPPQTATLRRWRGSMGGELSDRPCLGEAVPGPAEQVDTGDDYHALVRDSRLRRVLACRTHRRSPGAVRGRGRGRLLPSHEELHDKIRFYLREESLRQRIAAAGRGRCVRSGYSTQRRLEAILKDIAS